MCDARGQNATLAKWRRADDFGKSCLTQVAQTARRPSTVDLGLLVVTQNPMGLYYHTLSVAGHLTLMPNMPGSALSIRFRS